MWLIRLKQILRRFHIKSVVAGKERTSLDASGEAKINPHKIFDLIKKGDKSVSVTPESKIVLRKPFHSAQRLFQDLERFLEQVAEQ